MIANRLVRIAATALSLAALIGTTELASASTWAQRHPRRTEVNHRLAIQNRRIHREVREGELTRRQAMRMHREDHRVRHTERVMASRRHGAITPAEKRALNKRENRISRHIGQ